jgi:hypothetical protein
MPPERITIAAISYPRSRGLTIVRLVWAGACVACASAHAWAGPKEAEEPDPKPRVVLPDESAYSASPSDGRGTVSVTPAAVPVHSPVTLTFVYTADTPGIAPGGGIVCHVSAFWGWAPPQNQSPQHPGYVTVTCSDPDVRLDVQIDPQNLAIVAMVQGKALDGGQTVTFVYGDTSGGRYESARGFSDRYGERNERFFFKVDGDGDGWFVALEKQPRFDVVARTPARAVVYGPSWAQVGRPFDLTVAVLDATNNLVETFTGEATLTTSDTVACPRTVTFGPQDRGAVRVSATATAPGPVRVTASPGELAAGISNPIVVSAEAAPSYTLYWGDLQSHSNVSDGTGSPEDLYRYARDVARLDVFALTDHDHWGYRPLDEDPATWDRLCGLSRSWYEPGRFVTFPGYEWTNWTFGHRHVLFLHERDARVVSWQKSESDHPRELWSLLGSRDCVTISHHCGGSPIPTCWKYWDPRYEPVVEMASVHGVSEYVGHPRSIGSPVASGMVQSALARGYRLGIIGSGDTHDGHPGLGSPAARAGLAGIYATELTREAVFEALRARRVYATPGSRAILRFPLGDVPVGGVAKFPSRAADRTLSVVVLGDAPIASVAIIKNNQQAAAHPGDGWITSWEWTDPQPARSGDYYYACVVQTDGEWIWSSPIFVDIR